MYVLDMGQCERNIEQEYLHWRIKRQRAITVQCSLNTSPLRHEVVMIEQRMDQVLPRS